MKNQMFTGIGCFAKPDRLGRIFNKLVQDYALGPFESDQLFDQNIPAGSEGVDLLKALWQAQPETGNQAHVEPSNFRDTKKSPGFICPFLIKS